MSDGLFDKTIAANYDKANKAMSESAVLAPTVDALLELSDGGKILEFAIGTGRVALPLQQRGADVCGIELSQSMVDQMRAKPGGNQIPVTLGDMSSTRVDGEFSLVYLVHNTISNLITQDEQVNCFCNAADHLVPGGYFVVEDQIPRLRALPQDGNSLLFDTSSDHLGFDEYDTTRQLLVSHHYWFNMDQVETFKSTHRYTWPAELDLMARIAGMSLYERWSDWNRNSFTGESKSHISIWQKPLSS